MKSGKPNKDFLIVQLSGNHLKNMANSGKARWHYLFLIRKGRGKIQIDLKDRPAGPYTVLFIERYKRWKWVQTAGLEGTMIRFTEVFYNFIYTGNPIIKSDQSLAGNIPSLIKLPGDERNQWEVLLKALEFENSRDDENVAEITCLLLKTLMVMYNRNAHAGHQFFVYRGKEQILNNFIESLNQSHKQLKTPAEYGQILNITPNYLNLVCKKLMNKTAGKLIEERIVLEANRLLLHTNLTISEIAFNLGFKDNSYFTRYYRRATGTTPQLFRKNQHEKSES